jgi:trans-aconitate 2-methyltransferase
MTDWNSTLYMKFETERTRAARDLLANIPKYELDSVVDLGCGPGNATEILTAAFPRATIVGLDTSDNMLDVARARVPSAQFMKQDITNWRPSGKVDLIFANAVLHLVPNHHELLAQLISFLNDGGWFAAQMPNNIQEPSRALIRMVAVDGPWASRLVPIAKTRVVLDALDVYYQLLTSICSKVDIWQTTYLHPLDGPGDIVDWFEGSGLRPFLELLSASEQEAFVARYRAELSAAYPRQPNGKVLLRYPRLFLVAQK